MRSEAMRKEIAAIGHGATANCWCTHSCWITSSFVFNPRRMVTAVLKGYWEARRLNRPLDLSEAHLQALEQKYQLDPEKLKQLKIY